MTRQKIVIASKNPVKVGAALDGLLKMFPQVEFLPEPVSVPSGVADQPLSDEETLQGALTRVSNAQAAQPDADLWIGIEGGATYIGEDLAAFAWVVVRSRDQEGKARSGTFFLPAAVTRLIQQGMELGTADDVVFGRTNSKQEDGAIGLLTGGVVDRRQLYEQAVMLALIPFKNHQLYKCTPAFSLSQDQ